MLRLRQSGLLHDKLRVAVPLVRGVLDQAELEGVLDFNHAILDGAPRNETQLALDLGEGDGDVPHVAAEAEVLVSNLEALDMFLHQLDDLVLRVVAVVRPQVVDLAADLLLRGLQAQQDPLDNVPDMDEERE